MRRGTRQDSAGSAKPSWRQSPPSLPRFFDHLVSASRLARRAVAIAGELDHPVYDCLYLALAEAAQAAMVTSDMRLLGKVRATSWEQRVIDLIGYSPGSQEA